MTKKIYLHGLRNHYLYGTWYQMQERCRNPKTRGYEHYGGRGIIVCERWNNFANFLQDMGERPKGTTLDRIEVNGNYEPTNCRWATNLTQSLNKRNRNHSSIFKGVSWDASRKKWVAYIRIDGKTINLGRFVSEIDASQAFNKAYKLRPQEV